MQTIFKRRTHSDLTSTKPDKQLTFLRKVSSNLCSKSEKHQATTSIRARPKSLLKLQCQRSQTYNKWFIKPSNRLKKSVPQIKIDRKCDEFYYKSLFKSQYKDPQRPFEVIDNEKMKIFDKISQNSMACIESFRKTQMSRKKRIPQIVEMLMKRNKKFKTHDRALTQIQ